MDCRRPNKAAIEARSPRLPNEDTGHLVTESPRQTFPFGPLIVAGLLVLGGLFSLTAQFCSHIRTPSPEDWERAADKAVELAEPTDGVRVHPSWTETPMPSLRPVGNLLHRQHHPILEDFTGIERLLILTETRRRDEAMDRLPFDAEIDRVHDFGSVALLEVPIPRSAQIDGDATAYLDQATVGYHSGSDDGELNRCRWHAASTAWRCRGSRRGAMVRPFWMEIEHDPRRCVQAFPPSGQRSLVIELPFEQASEVLRVRAGLDERAARLEKGDDVIYRLFIDDELVADEGIDGHTSQWTAHDLSTADHNGGSVDVRLEVKSVAEKPHHRRFCFNAWALSGEQAQINSAD